MNERIKELVKQATSIEYGVDNGFDMVRTLLIARTMPAQKLSKNCASWTQANNVPISKNHARSN